MKLSRVVKKGMRVDLLITIFLVGITVSSVMGQCVADDQSFYPVDSWRGYVYDGMANYTSTDYQGYISEADNFDQSFCGDNCDFTTSGCDVNTETFSVRYRMNKNFTYGVYRFTVGGDDGVRLSSDGGSSFVLGDFNQHSYTTYRGYLILNGSHNMVFEYYENGGQNRVSLNYQYLGVNFGGTVAADQNFCGFTAPDADAFTSSEAAIFSGGGTPTYQWQISTDGSSWSDISGATSETYDYGTVAAGTTYFRRKAENGLGDTAYSNTITLTYDVPAGDETTFGNEQWIGYVYDGAADFSTTYIGQITETEIFDESFTGDNTAFSTDGCDVTTETFSVRFKMTKDFSCGDYTFTIGGDDGVRLIVDGVTVIDAFSDHGYGTYSNSTSLSLEGSTDLILEYYENGGYNRVTFNYSQVACTLPVELTSFDVDGKDDYNELHWSTASELNNDGFEVQRSKDGKSFETIAWVAGHGTTNDEKLYSFVDYEPLKGNNYYRLKQIDFDGQYEYSPVKFLYRDFPLRLNIYPNPAKDYVIVKGLGDDFSAYLNNIATQAKFTLPQNGNTLHVADVPAGVYVMSITTGGLTHEEKIIIIK
ncbi:T9SS type A sorting domain-containing protein [Fulvivirga ligni]|uniref:T9SS type A sorting domain-containing protein n=1 Tax=Fulvivirga ligni TaxID=2904246 RepID=UPI001F404B68|nr:T9SS type A sorting domain-containing protein [Fulvivirga ligni]UII22739.1 T9SS type A sorting domain-containing protein [Fulvivirga ligni]